MTPARIAVLFVLSAVLFFHTAPAHAVTIDWVTVGGAGNACDAQANGCLGSVADEFRISKFEITNVQYVEFLTAVASTDTNFLFDARMWTDPTVYGLKREGEDGAYRYSVIFDRHDAPVAYTTAQMGMRFANWIHNGQPTGLQDASTTEDGIYTFTGVNQASARSVGADIFLPNQDEWYKAAYYDVANTSYLTHPLASGATPICGQPDAGADTANCWTRRVNQLTSPGDVGSFTESVGPNGTFDQAGGLQEWTEEVLGGDHALWGGGWIQDASSTSSTSGVLTPSVLGAGTRQSGFRLASAMPATPVPEPSTALLLYAGVIGFSVSRRASRSERG